MKSRSIVVIAVANAVGAILTVAFWGLVWFRVFMPDAPPPGLDSGSVSTTFGFLVADLSWATILLVLSVVGLIRLRAWGWLSAQMVNILWLYSMTVIWCRDIHAAQISPGAVIFLPFVPFSAWAIVALWKVRDRFGIHQKNVAGSGLHS